MLMVTNKVIKHGVPQGSILSPISLLISINDLVRSELRWLITMQYVDDTTVY